MCRVGKMRYYRVVGPGPVHSRGLITVAAGVVTVLIDTLQAVFVSVGCMGM